LISKAEAQKPGGEASLAERKEHASTLESVKDEAWRLVINVLTDIFQELALRRADGQAAGDLRDDPSMQSAIVLHSSLKAHKFMDELVKKKLRILLFSWYPWTSIPTTVGQGRQHQWQPRIEARHKDSVSICV
jgi:hypothetical protein